MKCNSRKVGDRKPTFNDLSVFSDAPADFWFYMPNSCVKIPTFSYFLLVIVNSC